MFKLSPIQLNAERRCRFYVGEHRDRDGNTLSAPLDELLGVARDCELCRNLGRDQLVYALRFCGWTEDRGFWAVPEGGCGKCDAQYQPANETRAHRYNEGMKITTPTEAEKRG